MLLLLSHTSNAVMLSLCPVSVDVGVDVPAHHVRMVVSRDAETMMLDVVP